MQIKELYGAGRPVVSFEVFPPKQDTQVEEIRAAVEQLAGLAPDFISVTYGAGGGANKNYTVGIASHIQEQGVSSMAHITCIGADRERVRGQLGEMRREGIENLLALRGDLPREGELPPGDFPHAEDLIREIKDYGGFCIGAACYPEGHIDCENVYLDVSYIKRKEEAGADFLVSQLFFDNEHFLRFLDRARSAGITLPISAGVMPILGRAQIERMIFMCGASLPSGIVKLLHRYEDDPASLRKAGIEYAARQLEGLVAHRVDGIHIYTMNKPDIARHCLEHLEARYGKRGEQGGDSPVFGA